MSSDNINDFVPSVLKPRTIRKNYDNFSCTQSSVVSRRSLSLRRNINSNNKNIINEICLPNKENLQNIQNATEPQNIAAGSTNGNDSISLTKITHIFPPKDDIETDSFSLNFANKDISKISSATEFSNISSEVSESTIIYDASQMISLSFSLADCDKVDISSNKSNIRKISVGHNNQSNVTVDCEIVEGSQLSEITSEDNLNSDEPNSVLRSPPKRKVASVNLEIKKQKMAIGQQSANADKVLILKTNAIENLTYVIVQPPNYNLVKRKIRDKSIGASRERIPVFPTENNVISVKRDHLKQVAIDAYFRRTNVSKKNQSLGKSAVELLDNDDRNNNRYNEAGNMNKNSSVVDVKYDGRTSNKSHLNASSRASRIQQPSPSPKREIRTSVSNAPRTITSRSRKDSSGSFSARPYKESIHFSLPKPNKTPMVAQKSIPHYKIVAGTHFAVDAFSYGEIPNVQHYFLTHFHCDHYSGLKKSFNKLLYCSKITADLCTSRLGVSSKFIQVISVDETIKVEEVEVTVVDANHCPGAIMLIFTLPNGKTMLHTGDFRASPIMESFPAFWNKDVHTVYLDTTYCNPRYDFPTQEESLEMALYLLRQKKTALERQGKEFSSVLIVCGTYTIGKEKFFLGIARGMGCSVWACPEKDRVLKMVEGHSFSQGPPQSCQLHVVPMRDLTHVKLRNYLNSLDGVFSEVVAFKPSGWENGKKPSVEKDSVTIHGIPYSEHSSFSELTRFVKFLKPKQVIPTVDISGGIKAVAKYFPCPLVNKDDVQSQSKLTDFFSLRSR